MQGFHENKPTNTNQERTVSAIYLRPTQNSLTSHDVMNLETGRVNKVVKVTKLPITDHVIAAVNAMAAEQGVKSLKIESRNKVPLLPADWIAGVDYSNENSDYSNENSENDSIFSEENSQDEVFTQRNEVRYEYERDLRNEEKFQALNDDELQELLADRDAVDARQVNVTGITTRQQAAENEEEQELQENQEEQELPNSDEISNPINSGENEVEIAGVPEPLQQATRPTRNVQQPERMTYNKFGSPVGKSTSSFLQTLERKHNFITQTTPSMGEYEYAGDEAVLIARYITHLNTIDAETGLCFAQQYMFERGLKIFGDRG